MRSVVSVEVWSDIACPWCYIGLRRLQQARRRASVGLEISWHAYRLDPNTPHAADPGLDFVDRLARLHRQSRQEAERSLERVRAVGAELDICFAFERVVPTQTFDALRVVALAPPGPPQEAVSERLFRAYFCEGADVGDPATLIRLASEAGLDPEMARTALATDRFADAVRSDEQAALGFGITGVPFLVVGSRIGISGAQAVDVLLDAVARAATPAVDPRAGP